MNVEATKLQAVENDLKQRSVKTVSERSVAEQSNCKRTGKRVEYHVRRRVVIEGRTRASIRSTHGSCRDMRRTARVYD